MIKLNLTLLISTFHFLLIGQIINKEMLKTPSAFAFGANYKIHEFEDRYLLVSSSGGNYYFSNKDKILWENLRNTNEDYIINEDQLFFISEKTERIEFCSGIWQEKKYAYLNVSADRGNKILKTEFDSYNSVNDFQFFERGKIFKGSSKYLYWMPYSGAAVGGTFDNEIYYFTKANISSDGGLTWQEMESFYSDKESLSIGNPFLEGEGDPRLRALVVMNDGVSIIADGRGQLIYSNDPYFENVEVVIDNEVGFGNFSINKFEYSSSKDILYAFASNRIYKSLDKGRSFENIPYNGTFVGNFDALFCFQEGNKFAFYEDIESKPIKEIELDTSQFKALDKKQFNVVNDSVFVASVGRINYISRDFGSVWTRADVGKFRIPNSSLFTNHYFDFVGEELLHGTVITTVNANGRFYISQSQTDDYLFVFGNNILSNTAEELELHPSRVKSMGGNLFSLASKDGDNNDNLYISKDNGKSWKLIFETQSESFHVTATSIFILETDVLHRSDNNGLTWDSISFLNILPKGLDSFTASAFSWDGQNILLSNSKNQNFISRDGGASFAFLDFPEIGNGNFTIGNGIVYLVGGDGQIFKENMKGTWNQISDPFEFLSQCNSAICQVQKFNATNGFVYIELLSKYTTSYTCEEIEETRYFISNDDGENFHSCEKLNLDKYRDGYFYFLDNGMWRMSIKELYKYTPDSTVFVNLCDGEMFTDQEILNDTLILIEEEESILLYDIKVFTSRFDTINYRFCDEDSININGSFYGNEGVYLVDQISFFNSSCDSLIIFGNFTRELPDTTIVQDFICNRDTLYIGNASFTDPGLYLLNDTLSIYGCDSIGFLQLEVFDTFQDSIDIEVSEGDFYNDIFINSDTSWTEVYIDENGCENSTTFFASIITSLNGLLNLSNDIKYYPNPFSDVVQIEFMEQIQLPLKIQILDLKGIVFFEEKFEIDEMKNRIISLDLNNIPPGIYISRIITKNKYFLSKLNHI